jgi:hypothetical protein
MALGFRFHQMALGFRFHQVALGFRFHQMERLLRELVWGLVFGFLLLFHFRYPALR